MPFDGNGNWTSNYYPQSGELIKASDFNNTFIADIANGFGNCVTRDGQGVMQTNTNANNYRVINVADPVNDKDAVNLQTANAKDALCVHLAGEETITGNKTFTGNVSFTGSAGTDVVALGVPDYTSIISITSGYEATKNGWVVFTGNNNYADVWIAVDGVELCRNAGAPGSWVDSTAAQIIVGVGQTVTFYGGSCKFVPCFGG